MTQAISGYGTKLKWNGVEVAEITKFGKIGTKRAQIDVTNEDGSAAYREYIMGFFDSGTLDVEFNFIGSDPAQVAMLADHIAGTARACILTFPAAAAATIQFDGLLQEFALDPKIDGAIVGTAVIKITGALTLGVTASGNMTSLTGIEQNTGAALTFTPTFDGAKHEYNITVNTASTWVKLTPTKAAATIYVAGALVASGAQSGEVALTDGAVTNITITTKDSGKAPVSYLIHVYTP
jgi:hypothetical protein